jgi:HK97 family phage prohead protease
VTTHADPNPAQRAAVVLFSRAAVVSESVSDDSRTVDVVASTDDIDGHGTIVKQNWRLERFAENPVVLYSHDNWSLPIGLASKVGVVDGKLRATIKFSTADLNPKAEEVWKNVKAGVLRGVSAGFRPHTVTFEKHEDREVMILDDNELFELSMTPCPSNAQALAEMRSMHPPTPAPESQPTSPPAPAGSAKTESEPSNEERTMAETPKDPTNTMSVARALGLPAGATEQDAISRSVALRELEVQLMTLTGAQSSHEAIGALRGMRESADKLKATLEELQRVKAERDVQNFEALIARGKTENRLVHIPAQEANARAQFEQAVAQGRGAEKIEELRGWINAAPPDVRFVAKSQPNPTSGAGTPLVWNGKAYRDLKPTQRAALSKENPELFRLMKDDFDAAGAAA